MLQILLRGWGLRSIVFNHINQSSRESGGSTRPCLWYSGCYSQQTGCWPGCLWWNCVDKKSFGGRAGVSKAEFESRADHHYCTCVIVSQANTKVLFYRAAFLDCLAVFSVSFWNQSNARLLLVYYHRLSW